MYSYFPSWKIGLYHIHYLMDSEETSRQLLCKRVGGDILRRGRAEGDNSYKVASTPSHALHPNNVLFWLWPEHPSGLSTRSVSGQNWSRRWADSQSYAGMNSQLPEQPNWLLGITMLSLFKEEFRRTFCSSLDCIGGSVWNVLASNALEVSEGLQHSHHPLQSQRHSNSLFCNWDIWTGQGNSDPGKLEWQLVDDCSELLWKELQVSAAMGKANMHFLHGLITYLYK